MAEASASLKERNLKHIHEDDGAEGETERERAQPLDALAVRRVLASMGAERFEPRVVAQLQEFVHRYVTDVLIDAQEYAMYADKQTIDQDDVRLAIASRLNHQYVHPPSREVMMELAEKRNSIPLPPISNEYGVRLPPAQYQLVTHESERQDLRTPNTPRDAGASPGRLSGAFGDRPPLHPQAQGTRNKRVARTPIPINIHSS